MKILVRGANWIGDSVMTVPALRALRAAFPSDEITLHTRSWAEGIFRDADFIDRIIAYDRAGSSLNEVLRQARRLRQESFDIAVIFPNSLASAVATRFAGIPKRFGYSKEGRSFVLTDAFPVPEWRSSRHEVYYYLELIAQVAESLSITGPDLRITPEISVPVSKKRKDAAREFLAREGIDLLRPIVALGAGSTNSIAKRWPAVRYAELAGRFADAGARVVLLGGPGDEEISQAVTAAASVPPLDLTARTSLSDAAAILAACDLLVSNDMGLAHLAPAVGTRTIVVFGPTDPVTTRPFSPLAEVIRSEVECSPCMLRKCPIDHRCMTRVTVDTIFESAMAKLERK